LFLTNQYHLKNYQQLDKFQLPQNFRGKGAVTVQLWWLVQSWIGDDVVLYSLGEIEIGAHVVISQKSYICTGTHDSQAVNFDIYAHKIIIEDQCWIATDVYVASGITIGRGTLVGARSSVFKDLPAGKICLGSPAQVVKDR
jgi:putative colanic acid biosynthesis acetyltransferase WcaF